MANIKDFRGGKWMPSQTRTAVDPSLSKSGQAADAFATGKAIEGRIAIPAPGGIGQVLTYNGPGDYGWGNPASDEQTQAAVDKWLADHPDVTTTVQDGSITLPKFSSYLKSITVNGYASPEEYGAKSDGVYDDAIAINAAIQSGKPVMGFGPYYTKTPIDITGNFLTVCLMGGIWYTGNEETVRICGQLTNVKIGTIHTKSDGIVLRANPRTSFCRIDFDSILCVRDGLVLTTKYSDDPEYGSIMANTVYGGNIRCNTYDGTSIEYPAGKTSTGIKIAMRKGTKKEFVNSNYFYGIFVERYSCGISIKCPGLNSSAVCYGNTFVGGMIESNPPYAPKGNYAIDIDGCSSAYFEDYCFDELRAIVRIRNVFSCVKLHGTGKFPYTIDLNSDASNRDILKVLDVGLLKTAASFVEVTGNVMSYDGRVVATRIVYTQNGVCDLSQTPANTYIGDNGAKGPTGADDLFSYILVQDPYIHLDTAKEFTLPHIAYENTPFGSKVVHYSGENIKNLTLKDRDGKVIFKFGSAPVSGTFTARTIVSRSDGVKWVNDVPVV